MRVSRCGFRGIALALTGAFGVCMVGTVFAEDCNINGIPDECDVDCAAEGCVLGSCGGSLDINPANGIPDECEGLQAPATFTSTLDFKEGYLQGGRAQLINLNTGAGGLLERNDMPKPLPILWVAVTTSGTVMKINTDTGGQPGENGDIIGEYYSSPATWNGEERVNFLPSRTAVNLDGEVWVGNLEGDTLEDPRGSVVKIGLVIGGTPVETFCVVDNRVTLAPPFVYNTCVDRNGDGYITTSNGAGPLSWPNEGGADTEGGVSTAEDECILQYVRTTGTATRHVSVDADNNVWVGGHYRNNTFDLLDGFTGEILDATFDVECGGLGGLVDCNNVLWSASETPDRRRLFRYNTEYDDVYSFDCCEADMLADVNGDGVIDEADEAVEDTDFLIFPVNSDDDDGNDSPDYLDGGPAPWEDDLVEIKLRTACDLSDQDAHWSLSWVDPDGSVLIWPHRDKSNGAGSAGAPLDNAAEGTEPPYDWPPPSSVWVEALDTYDQIEITFTIWVNGQRDEKTDKVKSKVTCTPGTPVFQVLALKYAAGATGVSAEVNAPLPFPALCGSPPANKPRRTVGSYMYIGVEDFVYMYHPRSGQQVLAPQKWVQVGYMKRFRPKNGFVESVTYAEVWSGNKYPTYDDADPDYHFYKETGIHAESIEYKCYLITPKFAGKWEFYIKRPGEPELFRSLTHDNWKDATGNTISYAIETHTKEDERWGTQSAPVKFRQCKYAKNWESLSPVAFVSGDLFKLPPGPNYPAVIQLIANPPGCQSCEFEAWDTRR